MSTDVAGQPRRSTTTSSAISDRGDKALVGAAWFFTFAVLVHNSDHVRRGAGSLTKDVFWTGTAAIGLEIAIVVICCGRHRLAPLVSAIGGFALSAGYIVVHFLPSRGWLSDSFTSAPAVSSLSWFAASLEVAAASTIGIVGLVVLRRRGGVASAREPHPGELPLWTAFAHPVAMIMALGNAIVLGISLVQL
jgi:hypothetical protein